MHKCLVKNVVSILLTVISAVFCLGCQNQNERNIRRSDYVDTNVYTNNNSNIKGMSITDPRFVTEDYNEYLGFLRDTELPSHFVKYDPTIKMIGSFERYRETGEPFTYSQILYEVKDNSQYVIDINISTDFNEEWLKNYYKIERIPNSKDMRNSMSRGIFVYNNIRYYYDEDGELYKVAWYKDSMYISIGINCDKHGNRKELSDYPNISNTFVSKLLELDSAPQAVQEFNSSIE